MTLVSLTTLALIAIVAFLSSGAIGSIRMLWHQQMRSFVRTEQATFSDFINLLGLLLTVVAVIAGWYTIRLQAQHTALELSVKALADGNAAMSSQMARSNPESGRSSGANEVYLEWPTHDIRVVSSSLPELRWKYVGATAEVDYLVQILWLGAGSDNSLAALYQGALTSSAEKESCGDFRVAPACTFRATYADTESSFVPGGADGKQALRGEDAPEGKYLWRVVPINPSVHKMGSDYDLSAEFLTPWTEFGSFCLYNSTPAPNACDVGKPVLNSSSVPENTVVLIGTSYSDNVNFSWIRDGQRGGHDVDLIRLIVEDCLEGDRRTVQFDPTGCLRGTEVYRSHPEWNKMNSVAMPNHFRGTFTNFDTVSEGLAAVGRSEVDLFIGSLTRAKERERDNVRLTDGYFPLRTSLIVPLSKASKRGESLPEWLTSPRTVGVIRGSTNEWLADELEQMPQFGDRLTMIAFPTFVALKQAFESRELDGALLDSVLGTELDNVDKSAVRGGPTASTISEISLTDTSGWTKYLERIGSDHEEFAIAIADRAPRRPERAFSLRHLLNLPPEDNRASLFWAVEEALQSPEIQDVLPCIRLRNLVHSGGGTEFSEVERSDCAVSGSPAAPPSTVE